MKRALDKPKGHCFCQKKNKKVEKVNGSKMRNRLKNNPEREGGEPET